MSKSIALFAAALIALPALVAAPAQAGGRGIGIGFGIGLGMGALLSAPRHYAPEPRYSHREDDDYRAWQREKRQQQRAREASRQTAEEEDIRSWQREQRRKSKAAEIAAREREASEERRAWAKEQASIRKQEAIRAAALRASNKQVAAAKTQAHKPQTTGSVANVAPTAAKAPTQVEGAVVAGYQASYAAQRRVPVAGGPSRTATETTVASTADTAPSTVTSFSATTLPGSLSMAGQPVERQP